MVSFIFWPTRSTFAFFLLSTSPTAPCSQSNFHQRSSLKTVHRTVFFTVGFKSLRFLCVTKKQKTPQLWCLLFFWPTRRDLNPHSPESESVALSNCATDGYKPHFSYGCFFIIKYNQSESSSQIAYCSSCSFWRSSSFLVSSISFS